MMDNLKEDRAIEILKTLAPTIIIFLLLAIWLRRRENSDTEPVVYVRPSETQMKKLDLPLTATLQQRCEQWTLCIHSSLDDWYMYTLHSVDSETVVRDILKPNSLEELFAWLKDQEAEAACTLHHTLKKVYEVGVQKPDSGSVTPVENMCPLVVIATDFIKHALITLVHTGNSKVPLPYIIAQYYRVIESPHPIRLMSTFGDGGNAGCVVCMSEESTCTILPCRHRCLCLDCISLLNTCPICRCTIVSYFNMNSS